MTAGWIFRTLTGLQYTGRLPVLCSLHGFDNGNGTAGGNGGHSHCSGDPRTRWRSLWHLSARSPSTKSPANYLTAVRFTAALNQSNGIVSTPQCGRLQLSRPLFVSEILHLVATDATIGPTFFREKLDEIRSRFIRVNRLPVAASRAGRSRSPSRPTTIRVILTPSIRR